jgi:hypothetical protein
MLTLLRFGADGFRLDSKHGKKREREGSLDPSLNPSKVSRTLLPYRHLPFTRPTEHFAITPPTSARKDVSSIRTWLGWVERKLERARLNVG